MNTYEINKTFASHEECDAWEEENLMKNGRMIYNGEYVLMVNHAAMNPNSDEITITEIITV